MHQVTPPRAKSRDWLGCKNLQITPLEATSVDFIPSWVSLESLLEGEKVVKLIQWPSWPKHRFMRPHRGERIRVPFNHRMPTTLRTARFNPVMFGHYLLWEAETSQLNWPTMLWSSQISCTVCPWMDSGPIISYCHNCLPDGISIEQRLKSISTCWGFK